MSKGNGILYRAKDYLKDDTLLTLYYSFIHPYIVDYIEAWGSTTKGNLVSLLKLQKTGTPHYQICPNQDWLCPSFPWAGNLISP